MNTVYLGLGANLNTPRKQIHAAVTALKALKDVEFVCVSHDYASKPMGPQDQPDYSAKVIWSSKSWASQF